MSADDTTDAVRLEPAPLPSSGFSPRATALRLLTAKHRLPYGWTLVLEQEVEPVRGDFVLVVPRFMPPILSEVHQIDAKTLTIGSAVDGTEQRFSRDSVGLATVTALYSPGDWTAADSTLEDAP